MSWENYGSVLENGSLFASSQRGSFDESNKQMDSLEYDPTKKVKEWFSRFVKGRCRSSWFIALYFAGIHCTNTFVGPGFMRFDWNEVVHPLPRLFSSALRLRHRPESALIFDATEITAMGQSVSPWWTPRLKSHWQ
jgi:hypothetical protein